MSPRFDVKPFLDQDEGQHFDRKSLYEGPPDGKRVRDRRGVRDQVCEYVAAFANAEGGVLILGLEDGGALTGHRYPDKAVVGILEAPTKRLRPPQAPGFRIEHDGAELLVFDVASSDVPVRVDGDGFPLRMGDRTVQASETEIRALKFQGLVQSWEAQPCALPMGELDSALVQRVREAAGLAALSDEEYLLKRRLADRQGRGLALRRAAALLFAKNGPDHPNAGLRIFRVIGTERKFGLEHNVEERPRVEGNLASVLEHAFEEIQPLIRRPSRLRGIRFREVPEYPEFSWKEAILNAVAHRDYSIEGRTTEIWFFDDRLEVSSPGGLVKDLQLEELLKLKRVHMSRNPRTVRGLVDLSWMRDQGEGLPRMFAEMDGALLPPPVVEVPGREFRVTLKNAPEISSEDRVFIGALSEVELSDPEYRVLLEAWRAGRVDNARLRELSGLDTLGASALLRRLRDRGFLELHAAGADSYYELGPQLEAQAEASRPAKGDLSSQETIPDPAALEPEAEAILSGLGRRPRKEKLRNAILGLTRLRPWTPVQLAEALGFSNVGKLVERHLSPMVEEGSLTRTHPENPSHPAQAYSAAQLHLDA